MPVHSGPETTALIKLFGVLTLIAVFFCGLFVYNTINKKAPARWDNNARVYPTITVAVVIGGVFLLLFGCYG